MSYPDQLKLDNQLCFLLYSASRSMTRRYRPLLDELGLTYPQYLVMLVLWEAEGQGLSIGEIGESLMLDTGTLTPLLKRLEQNGLISRVRSLEDERRVDVCLTKEGLDLRSRAEVVPLKMMCDLEINEDDLAMRDTLMQLLQQLNAKLAGSE
ncbi:MarR family winged helix-turn-helix transcriptional regulator [Litoribrevibacter euphylliae]|uniref:MarR family winged helix-turn-helix transcriptional regulator n=1 Tax=Litoribrevibacter euphylliae TaxID=1834034 RepID=A0ABV7HBJ0_9GAMM